MKWILANLTLSLAGLLAPSLRAAFDAPPPSRQQVEADWLRQDDLRFLPASSGSEVTREQDAAGAVDGVKDGKWGFHTADENQPWWQVDLGQPAPIERVAIWNRCDGHAARNARIIVSLSDDGKSFRQAHQHDGTVFQGFTDQKPLVVKLPGASARFVRLSLPEKSYFHLDEVEVFATGATNNLALRKRATQSSTSQWSARHGQPAISVARDYPIAKVLERGQKLGAALRRLGKDVDGPMTALQHLALETIRLPSGTDDATRRALYFRAHWVVREMALANPLLDFDSILFVKRVPSAFPHMSDQHYGWWSRPGGGIYLLKNFRQPVARFPLTPFLALNGGEGARRAGEGVGTSDSSAASGSQVFCLTADMPEGSFTGPDISFDGKKVLFAYCRFYPGLHDQADKVDKAGLSEDAFYHIYEMNVDGSGRRQITRGKYDDFDPRWLPDGRIAFLSTRKGVALQTTAAFSDSTRAADLPDSYVRCGGDNKRPVPVFTLHSMDAGGRDLRPLSSFENFEWTPSVASDGRILYTRWDYIDRFNGHFFSLWSANQDGANPQLVYGNYTVKPQVKFEARSIPGSSKLVITAGAHHSITGGSLCLLDRERGTEEASPVTRLTPEVCFPETEGWPEHYYANPWPLSEEFFLVGWADAKLPPHRFVVDQNNPTNAMGLYLYDAFGNLELLYRDPEISSGYPMPVQARVRPPVQTAVAQWNGEQSGAFLLQDVYRGLSGVPRGSVKQLRVIGVPPKVQPHMNNPVIGVSAEDPGKYVLGTVPVEKDGSAHFRVPSGVPVLFQALDEQGVALQTMRTLTYTVPGQTLACVGCHEHRDAAPPTAAPVLAASREPSKLTPGPDGSWPLRFDRLVQPLLDRQCVTCHHAGSTDAQAATLDLTAANAWKALLTFGGEDLQKRAFERDRSVPGDGTAANSKLWQLLTAGHRGVQLTTDDRARLLTWMDTYAQRTGHYSEEQEKELAAFRARWAAMRGE